MKLAEAEDEQREALIAYIGKRWSQLSDLELAAIADAIKYLMLANSGAAGAVLAFMSQGPAYAMQMWTQISLGLFVLGLLLVGFFHAVNFHRVNHVYKSWRTEVGRFYGGDIEWHNLLDADAEKQKRLAITLPSLAYGSFGCLLLGAVIGMYNFLF